MCLDNLGCYGSPTSYAGDSKHCQRCSGYESCGEKVVATIAAIKGEVSVKTLMTEHKALMEKYKVKRSQETLEVKRNAKEKEAIKSGDIVQIDNGYVDVNTSPFFVFSHKLNEKGVGDVIKRDIKQGTNTLFGVVEPSWFNVAVNHLFVEEYDTELLEQQIRQVTRCSVERSAYYQKMATTYFCINQIIIEMNGRYVVNPDLL